ncbi:MAG TPA: glycerol-3-phosphate 1-O-acyltransferase PlsY [Candidatus Paceibacterota bacterium]|nr:glycerol-3-phosphate 1-O-acyltransferase PlsY [Candidatus Paceibacterota bacterium]
MSYSIIAIAAYFLGSIPTGFLMAKAKGIDIRQVGSGNIGATNAFRVLGKPAGTFVLIADALKGYIAAAWMCDLLFKALNVPAADAGTHRIIAGVCAVMGHNYTCWLKFKGGKGIATTAGVYIALAPLAVGIAIVTWIVFATLSRYVSVASIAAAVALPTAVWFTRDSVLLGVVTTALGLLAIYKHKKNIQRLMNGTENRIGKKAPKPEVAK